MTKKEKRLSTLLLGFCAFLFICALINLFAGNIGAAICSLVPVAFFMCIWYVYYNKNSKDGKNKQ